MTFLKDLNQTDRAALARSCTNFAADLYPICRSITGNGMRETLARIKRRIPLQIFEVPTGAQRSSTGTFLRNGIFAMLTSRIPRGKRVVDFRKCNLHIMNYSIPVHDDDAARASSGRICLRFRSIPIGFLTERHTTRKTGDFAFPITRCWHSRTASTRCASTPRSKMGT